MSEGGGDYTFEFLAKNIYPKLRKKMKTITFQVEFNTLMNLLKDAKTMRTFVLREMHGICTVHCETNKEYSYKEEFTLIFPKKKNVNLKLNDFFQNNINSKHIYVDNYVMRVKLIYNEEWEKYKKIIFRFISKNKDKQTNVEKNIKETNNNN